MTGERISVVLPVYNERDNIAACLTGLWRALAHVEHEILVCYDTDEDSTLEGIRAMGDAAPPSLVLIKNTLGRGPHRALEAGFRAARGDVVVTSMADLSDPPELIPVLAAKVRAGCDVVSGSRYMSGGTQRGGPLLKRSLSRAAGVSLAWLAGLGTHDATSNFRAYSKRFLDRSRIEASGGFEIALELTVKAHLAGGRVGEVPSSWTDRTAGQSRFRLWKWLPTYLRWYLLALREPLAAWAAILFGLWWALGLYPGPEHEAARLLAWTSLAGAASALLWARAVRGRTRWLDAGQALVWFAPPFVSESPGATAAILLARCLGGAALVAATAGFRATWGSLSRALARVDQRVVVIALLAALLTLERVEFVEHIAGSELDPSWHQSLGRALLEGKRFGVEVQFTLGPLGYFMDSPYEPGLYWTKTVAYEIVLRLVGAGFVAVAIARVPGVLERLLCALCALVFTAGQDAWAFTVVASIGCWYFARPGRGVLLESLGTGVLVVLSLVKFTWLMYAAVIWSLFGLWCLRTHGLHRALRTPAIAAALLLGLWCALGQRALDLPRYVGSSWAIASGYAGAMGEGQAPELQRAAIWLLVLTGLAAAWNTLRRPFSARALALSLAICAGAFLAFKAGFVRQHSHPVIFLSFVAVAPFLLSASGETLARTRLDRLRNLLLLGTRVAVVVLAAMTFTEARMAERMLELFVNMPPAVAENNLDTLLDLDSQRRRIVGASRIVRRRSAMPQVVALVGQEPIDLLGDSQGVLFANGLNWAPRPVFQSYVAYTPGLLRANADYLEGPRAPPFLLLGGSGIDQHLPNMEDTLALQVTSRDYRFVLEERGHLLLERDPAPAEGRAAREVQIDTEIPFEEWIEIGGTPGSAHLLQLEIERTPKAALLEFALRPPPLYLDIEDSRGREFTFRIIPAMMEAGVFVQPFPIGMREWGEWFTNGDAARVQRVRLSLGQDGSAGGCYRPVARLRLIRADDLVPRRPSSAADARMLLTEPDEVGTVLPCRTADVAGEQVLVVHAPAELVYQVEAGSYQVRARYGLLPAAEGCSGAVRFSVVRISDGEKKMLVRRLLEPPVNESDRGVHELELVVTAAGTSQIVLRTRSLSGAGCEGAWWDAVEVLPVKPKSR
jgi:hypothetical protein